MKRFLALCLLGGSLSLFLAACFPNPEFEDREDSTEEGFIDEEDNDEDDDDDDDDDDD